jgi:glycosyltransferase involved in cell wall biosynthesis
MENPTPLISICIPTYNRSEYLDVALNGFCTQIEPYKNLIELIVSDNYSTDNTKDVVNKYLNNGYKIYYHTQPQNIGPDANFMWCFNNAKGKYFWIFGDDDVLSAGGLSLIMNVLTKNNPDILYINSYPFYENHIKEKPTKKPLIRISEVEDIYSKKHFIKKVNIMTTFISANIVNKNILPENADISRYAGTNLIQLAWIFEAFLCGQKFSAINNKIIAAKADNTGGYKLFKTFSINLNQILLDFEDEKKLPMYVRKTIRFNLLLVLFPYFIIRLRSQSNNAFESENAQPLLETVFAKNIWYYIFVYPIFYLPVGISKFYANFFFNKVRRLNYALVQFGI